MRLALVLAVVFAFATPAYSYAENGICSPTKKHMADHLKDKYKEIEVTEMNVTFPGEAKVSIFVSMEGTWTLVFIGPAGACIGSVGNNFKRMPLPTSHENKINL